MKEFDELIFSFMNLDLNQKKAALSAVISESIDNVSNNVKQLGINGKLIETGILNELSLTEENDYLTYIYILASQLEDITSRYISSKKYQL